MGGAGGLAEIDRVTRSAPAPNARHRVGEVLAQARRPGEPSGEIGPSKGDRPDVSAVRMALGQPKPRAPAPPLARPRPLAVPPPKEAPAGPAPAAGVTTRHLIGFGPRIAGYAIATLIATLWPWDMQLMRSAADLPPFVHFVQAPPAEFVGPAAAIVPPAPSHAAGWTPVSPGEDVLGMPRPETSPQPVDRAPAGVSVSLGPARLALPATRSTDLPSIADAGGTDVAAKAPGLSAPGPDAPPTLVAAAPSDLPIPAGVETTSPPPSRQGAAGAATRVVIHYQRARDAAFRDALTSSLRGAGFEAVQWRAVDDTVRRTQTRYFHDADRTLSDRAAAVLSALGRPAEERDFTHYVPPARSGTLEVWLSN